MTNKTVFFSNQRIGNKGYETKMYVMAVPKINSYLGTIERYETMYADDPMTARATPKQAHDIVVKNLPTNLETLHKTGLFSDIRLYNREGVKLYSSLETVLLQSFSIKLI
ncbi:zeta toxin family protein [Enterococcus faecalis]|nr:zeta toxin family protein [Enterococcus faecalis]EKZ0224679.1 zeta toxin family protein [Enterococcus faecalis]HDT8141569.1 zeta toxin family protein [Enterococcus faecalis]HDT8149670.1 zeta toxin family protein [Enterococcus faecalis]